MPADRSSSVSDPIIFKGFKALTLADTQQQSLLRLALEGISVYSPHTAVDAAPGGLGDWLADIVTGTLPSPEPETHTADLSEEKSQAEQQSTPPDDAPKDTPEDAPPSTQSKPQPPAPRRPTAALQRTYSKPTYPTPPALSSTPLRPSSLPHTRHVIRPLPANPPKIPKGSGMGRLVRFETAQPLTHLIERIARGVGTPKGFPVAIPQGSNIEDIKIRSVGICAGSGHDVLANTDADLLFTGELSHHQALAATERGRCVVTLFHTNTERGFLSSVLKPQLEGVLKKEWDAVRAQTRRELETDPEGGPAATTAAVDNDEAWDDAVRDEDVLVEVSERDRDPFGIVVLQASEQKGHPL